jgi:hypothetical protein
VRPRLGWAVAQVVLLASCSAIGQDELPKVASRPRAMPPTSDFEIALAAAEVRYARGIECGTQYLLEMAELAKQADEHVPELVSAFQTGKAESEASTVLRLMQDRALLAVPGLMELANDPSPAVRQRAQAALQIVFEAAEPARTTCGMVSSPAGRGRRTRG